jgi:hypothetical protein
MYDDDDYDGDDDVVVVVVVGGMLSDVGCSYRHIGVVWCLRYSLIFNKT